MPLNIPKQSSGYASFKQECIDHLKTEWNMKQHEAEHLVNDQLTRDGFVLCHSVDETVCNLLEAYTNAT